MFCCCYCFCFLHVDLLCVLFLFGKPTNIDSDLYYGDNDLGQRVFTWMAQQNVTAFTGDISPLLQTLGNFSGPDSDDYLGYLAFGSEVLYSFENVTVSVPRLEMDVVTMTS